MSLINSMAVQPPAPSELKPSEIQNFFNSIAPRYDLLNTLLSFRLDDYWRHKSRDLLYEGWENSILDLGVGTGKFLNLFLVKKKWKQAVGLDFSFGMLKKNEIASEPAVPRNDVVKAVIASEAKQSRTHLIQGDFHSLPFSPEIFDLVISAFTLRSVRQMGRFLEEVYRLLKEGGKAGFLCLTRPTNPLAKLLFYPYLKWYLPWLGGMLSGNREAYRFLADSILEFQEPTKTVEMMRATGFQSVHVHRFTLGVATLIIAQK